MALLVSQHGAKTARFFMCVLRAVLHKYLANTWLFLSTDKEAEPGSLHGNITHSWLSNKPSHAT
jgi:hypothetical protein